MKTNCNYRATKYNLRTPWEKKRLRWVARQYTAECSLFHPLSSEASRKMEGRAVPEPVKGVLQRVCWQLNFNCDHQSPPRHRCNTSMFFPALMKLVLIWTFVGRQKVVCHCPHPSLIAVIFLPKQHSKPHHSCPPPYCIIRHCLILI